MRAPIWGGLGAVCLTACVAAGSPEADKADLGDYRVVDVCVQEERWPDLPGWEVDVTGRVDEHPNGLTARVDATAIRFRPDAIGSFRVSIDPLDGFEDAEFGIDLWYRMILSDEDRSSWTDLPGNCMSASGGWHRVAPGPTPGDGGLSNAFWSSVTVFRWGDVLGTALTTDGVFVDEQDHSLRLPDAVTAAQQAALADADPDQIEYLAVFVPVDYTRGQLGDEFRSTMRFRHVGDDGADTWSPPDRTIAANWQGEFEGLLETNRHYFRTAFLAPGRYVVRFALDPHVEMAFDRITQSTLSSRDGYYGTQSGETYFELPSPSQLHFVVTRPESPWPPGYYYDVVLPRPRYSVQVRPSP